MLHHRKKVHSVSSQTSAKFAAESLECWHSRTSKQKKQRRSRMHWSSLPYQMPNIKSITLVTIDFAGAATLPVARRPASRLTFVFAFGSYGRGKAWFDAPVLFEANDFEGKETINPPWLLRAKLSSSCCRCTASIGFTPTIRPLLSWIPFFWRAFRAS